jgi:hypothetical protein
MASSSIQKPDVKVITLTANSLDIATRTVPNTRQNDESEYSPRTRPPIAYGSLSKCDHLIPCDIFADSTIRRMDPLCDWSIDVR